MLLSRRRFLQAGDAAFQDLLARRTPGQMRPRQFSCSPA